LGVRSLAITAAKLTANSGDSTYEGYRLIELTGWRKAPVSFASPKAQGKNTIAEYIPTFC
jgi:hypothetical protein